MEALSEALLATADEIRAASAFHRYEDASLRYTGIESHDGLTHYGCMTPWLRGTKEMHVGLRASNRLCVEFRRNLNTAYQGEALLRGLSILRSDSPYSLQR
jgi:hypothetical protein